VTAPFDGRRAVVTGGANGIGAAIVAALSAAGAGVAVLDLEEAPAATASVRVDLSDATSLPVAAAEAVSLLGGCDILVNCAGISLTGPLLELGADLYHRVLAVNLHAPVFLMKELGGRMAEAGYGRIVNVSSVHGRLSEPGCLAYDVSKGGLEAATRTAALELAPSGILVNAVAPGFVRTRMSIVDGEDELESAWFRDLYVARRRLPLARPSSPGEIAEAVAWLASDSNTYVTGEVLTVDGGLSARF